MRCTRWVELWSVSNLKAATLAYSIETNLIARFGCRVLHYDQQSAMMSNLFQSMLKILRVRSKVAIAGMHLTTGLAERTVRTVEQIIKAHIGEYKGSWHKILPFIAFNLRQVPCALLPFSAHQLVFGENLNGGLSDLVDEFLGAEQHSDDVKVRCDVGKYLADLRERLELTRKIADEHAEKVQTRNKEYYDKRLH